MNIGHQEEHEVNGQTPFEFLRLLFDSAVSAADPMKTIPLALPERPEHVVVVGAGKASARMAEAVEEVWGPSPGFVITRYGYARPTRQIEIVEAAHPVPDQAGAQATLKLIEKLDNLDDSVFVLSLISGGGSSLLCAPAGKITLEEKMALNGALLSSGAPISHMNIVRKHLSRIKGGQLAAHAYPARVLSLMISDVPGDDPAAIASGPTVGDCSTPQDAMEIIDRYGLDLSESIRTHLEGTTGVVRPDDERLARTENRIISAPSQSLEVACRLGEQAGCRVIMLGDNLEGEARDLGRRHGEVAKSLQREATASGQPILLLSGGECTVTRTGNGVGGPNAEYALGFLRVIADQKGIYALSCDTDGVDGSAEVAGAMVSPQLFERSERLGFSADDCLARNDAHTFFAQLNAQVVTGPTLTNVNDFRAALIFPLLP